MRELICTRLAQGLLLAAVLCTTSSCQVLGPLIAMPFRLIGSALQMFSANPLGTAASAAMVF